MIDNDLLTFDGDVAGYPTSHALIIRDDNELLIYANRSQNADSEWEIRSYEILGDSVSFTVTELDRANVAAILIEEFDPDKLTIDDRYSKQRPVRNGVPIAVAVDGKPAIAAWLYVRGKSRNEIADQMDVGERTVGEYLSRFRRRGDGIPDDLEVPNVGDIVPEIPAAFDPSKDRQQIVADGGSSTE